MINAPEGEDALPDPTPLSNDERPREYVADVTFDAMGLSPELRRAVAERGYAHPTPVQARAYAPVLAGRDLIVRSKTGTGKTAAFGMPLIDRIPPGTREVRALILCPTRELALQVAQELGDLAKHRDIHVNAIYGGASLKQQEDALRVGSAIVVGTPGRVYDHIRRGNLKLGTAAHAVLDEADEMLNQGFYEEVTRILDCLPQGRQVLLFSATVPEDIQRLIAKYTKNAETLLLSGDVYTVEHIHHVRYDVSDAYPKPRNLLYLLEMEEPENAIIFCNTRDDTELVTAVLNRNGLDAELLNGDLPQKERERVMAKVKRGEVAYMVATDIAARGIDISDLSHVINYSLPEDPAVYLHRVGRTGRIGRKGTALNLVTGRELMTLAALEKKYGVRFEQRVMPTAEQAITMWTERHVREVRRAAQESIFEGYLPLAEQLKRRPDADELIAFLLRSFFSHLRIDRARAALEQHEAPSPQAPRVEGGGGRRDREGRRGRDRSHRDDRPGRRGREDRAERGPPAERAARSSEERPRQGAPRTTQNVPSGERARGGEGDLPRSVEGATLAERSLGEVATGAGAVPAGGPASTVVVVSGMPEAPAARLAQAAAAGLDLEARTEDPRHAAPASSGIEAAKAPPSRSAETAARRLSDRELFEQLQRSQSAAGPASAGAQQPAAEPPRASRTGADSRRLNDRAIFEAMQAGRPLPASISEEPAGAEARREPREHVPAFDEPAAGMDSVEGSSGDSLESTRDEVRATRLRPANDRAPGRRRSGESDRREHGSRGRGGRRGARPSRPAHSVRGTAGGPDDQVGAAPQPSALPSREGPPLHDAALIEALQHGAPIPPIDDPTIEGGSRRTDEDGERRRRRGRGRREGTRALEPGELRLWVNLGRADGYEADALGVALAGLGAARERIRSLELRDTFSYLTVAEADAPALQALSGTTLGEKAVRIEPARK